VGRYYTHFEVVGRELESHRACGRVVDQNLELGLTECIGRREHLYADAAAQGMHLFLVRPREPRPDGRGERPTLSVRKAADGASVLIASSASLSLVMQPFNLMVKESAQQVTCLSELYPARTTRRAYLARTRAVSKLIPPMVGPVIRSVESQKRKFGQ
jgi:hypothetical protein